MVLKKCSGMEYLDHVVPTLEICIGETISFTPEISYGLVTDSGLQLTDNNGVSFSDLGCTEATVTYVGIRTDFMTFSGDNMYTVTFTPTQIEHLGEWPINI
jgi:hypothetical protein